MGFPTRLIFSFSLNPFQAEAADGSMNTMKETISAVENIFALSAFDLSNMAENGSVGKCAKGKPEEVEMR